MNDKQCNEEKKSMISNLNRIVELAPEFIALIDRVNCNGNDYFFIVDGVKIQELKYRMEYYLNQKS